ncbi:hypothetical protein [Streptomyces sp. R08]|uniref:Uncharacterized protein n=1 Tax=Streptomyces sp. R08 TaxID=3238624 RepID=A0AB39M8P0_9ACTN
MIEGQPFEEVLSAAVSHEVGAIDAAWQGDWPRAVDQAKKVIEALPGTTEIRRYQALWHYLLGSWAVAASRSDGQPHWKDLADRHFGDARAAARGTQWLRDITTDANRLLAPLAPTVEAAEDPLDTWVIEAVTANPARTSAKQYVAQEKTVREGLVQVNHKPFEAALDALGRLMGADVLPRSGEEAQPDSVWMFGDHWWIAVEAKSEAAAEKEVPVRDIREACGHLSYAAAQTGRTVPDGSITFLATPQTDVAKVGDWVADKPVFLVSPQLMLQVADQVLGAWDAIRAQTRELQPEAARPMVAALLIRHQALPSQWLPTLTARLIGLPQ